MKTILAVFALVVTACASTSAVSRSAPPVNVVVVGKAPIRQSDVDLFRKITQYYVGRYVHDGQPLTVSVTLGGPAQYVLGRDAAASNGYWAIESSYPTQTGHAVPLVGGMTAAQVGFIPVVGQSGSGGFVSATYFGGMVTAQYSITDASGKVLESHFVPLFSAAYATSPFVGARLEDYHDIGRYIAKRVAKAR